jgi:hypothetical protein
MHLYISSRPEILVVPQFYHRGSCHKFSVLPSSEVSRQNVQLWGVKIIWNKTTWSNMTHLILLIEWSPIFQHCVCYFFPFHVLAVALQFHAWIIYHTNKCCILFKKESMLYDMWWLPYERCQRRATSGPGLQPVPITTLRISAARCHPFLRRRWVTRDGDPRDGWPLGRAATCREVWCFFDKSLYGAIFFSIFLTIVFFFFRSV